MTIEDADAIKQEKGRLRRRLRELDAERTDLEAALAALERQQSAVYQPARFLASEGTTVTSSSPASAKIALFRGLTSIAPRSKAPLPDRRGPPSAWPRSSLSRRTFRSAYGGV